MALFSWEDAARQQAVANNQFLNQPPPQGVRSLAAAPVQAPALMSARQPVVGAPLAPGTGWIRNETTGKMATLGPGNSITTTQGAPAAPQGLRRLAANQQVGNMDVTFAPGTDQAARQRFLENPVRPTAQIARFGARQPAPFIRATRPAAATSTDDSLGGFFQRGLQMREARGNAEMQALQDRTDLAAQDVAGSNIARLAQANLAEAQAREVGPTSEVNRFLNTAQGVAALTPKAPTPHFGEITNTDLTTTPYALTPSQGGFRLQTFTSPQQFQSAVQSLTPEQSAALRQSFGNRTDVTQEEIMSAIRSLGAAR